MPAVSLMPSEVPDRCVRLFSGSTKSKQVLRIVKATVMRILRRNQYFSDLKAPVTIAGPIVCPVWLQVLDLTSFAIELYSIAQCVPVLLRCFV